MQLAVFRVAGQRYAVPLDAAEHVLAMVAIAALSGAPDCVLGVVNVHGDVVPVLDIRRRLGLPAVEYGRESRLLLARTPRRVVALPVDEVAGVAELPHRAFVPAAAVLPRIDHIAGIAAVADGVLLIHDLEAFFSLDEERQLAAALREETP